MTIELRNVTKRVRLGSVKLTYHDLNIAIEPGARVAFLGHREAGLEAIVDLICAADAPDKGRVSRSHSISWPIPSSVFLSKHLTLAANARFMARLHEADERTYLAQIAELGQLHEFMHTRVDQVSNETRSSFCFFTGVCLPFEHYILTKVGVGKKPDRPRILELVQELGQRSGLLLAGNDVKSAEALCDQAYVFDEGQATYYDDMQAALEHFKTIETKDEEEEDEMDDSDPELRDLVSEDF